MCHKYPKLQKSLFQVVFKNKQIFPKQSDGHQKWFLTSTIGVEAVRVVLASFLNLLKPTSVANWLVYICSASIKQEKICLWIIENPTSVASHHWS